MRDTHGFTIALVIADPDALVLHGVLEAYCEQNGIPLIHESNVNAPAIVERIRDAEPDFLFSVYNMQLLSNEILSLPRKLPINFHNGPLPRYRGVNVYSWAIINGESDYGISWHEIVPGVDAGAILSTANFEIEAKDTPTTLMAKGFDAGVQALDDLLEAIREESVEPRPQDETLAAYFSRKQLPNGGYIDLASGFESVERFLRALDFRPLPNTFVYPTLSYANRKFYCQSVRLREKSSQHPTGQVVEITGESLSVQIADSIVEFGDFLDSRFRPAQAEDLAEDIGLTEGSILDLTADESAEF